MVPTSSPVVRAADLVLTARSLSIGIIRKKKGLL